MAFALILKYVTYDDRFGELEDAVFYFTFRLYTIIKNLTRRVHFQRLRLKRNILLLGNLPPSINFLQGTQPGEVF
jgi:hypothetical protein